MLKMTFEESGNRAISPERCSEVTKVLHQQIFWEIEDLLAAPEADGNCVLELG
jgi:hypothetical protein